LRTRYPHSFFALLGTLLWLLGAPAFALNATWNAASDVPVTAASYTASGTVNFTLNFAPPMGTNLTVVNNTGLGFISGTFSNLAQGQSVLLSYGGVGYSFVANYYGGNGYGQLGNNSTGQNGVPVAVSQWRASVSEQPGWQ